MVLEGEAHEVERPMMTSFDSKSDGREMVCEYHYGTCCIAAVAFSD